MVFEVVKFVATTRLRAKRDAGEATPARWFFAYKKVYKITIAHMQWYFFAGKRSLQWNST